MNSTNTVVANALKSVNALPRHNDIEMEYVSSATALVFKKLGEINAALDSHWRTEGERLKKVARAMDKTESSARIDKAHDRILKNLNAAMNLFGNRANFV